MTVTINRTDGTVLTTIADGSADTTSTNIALIGRLYKNYGELVNENFVKLLENFAGTSSPSIPIEGQIWYDRSERTIKVYRSTGFTPLARITSTAAEPSNARLGDQWWDTNDEQLRLYDGTGWVTIAPLYTAGQGKTGAFPEIRVSTDGSPRLIVAIYQAGTIIATFSNNNVSFVPAQAINGIPTIDNGLTVKNRIRSNGGLNVDNNDGIEVGEVQQFSLYTDNDAAYFSANGSTRMSFLQDKTTEVFRIRNGNPTVAIAYGTETLPGLNFISDNTTGMYAPSFNQIAFSTNGVNRMTIRNTAVDIEQTLNTTESVNVGNNLNVSNELRLNGGVLEIPNDLAITGGDIGLTGALLVNGVTTITDDFVVNGGDTSLVGSVGITGSMLVNGVTTITDDFVVNGGDTALVGSVGITGSMLVNGVTTITDDFVVNGGDTAFIGTVGITGSVQIAGVTNITDNFNVTGNINVLGNFVSVGAVDITGNVFVDGNIIATGDIYAPSLSDERLKTNIVPIENALGKLRKITGVMFDWTDEEMARRGVDNEIYFRKHDTGVLAQDVEEVLPEVVATRNNGFKAIKYEKLAGLIIQAVNELADEVDSIKEEIRNMKK